MIGLIKACSKLRANKWLLTAKLERIVNIHSKRILYCFSRVLNKMQHWFVEFQKCVFFQPLFLVVLFGFCCAHEIIEINGPFPFRRCRVLFFFLIVNFLALRRAHHFQIRIPTDGLLKFVQTTEALPLSKGESSRYSTFISFNFIASFASGFHRHFISFWNRNLKFCIPKPNISKSIQFQTWNSVVFIIFSSPFFSNDSIGFLAMTSYQMDWVRTKTRYRFWNSTKRIKYAFCIRRVFTNVKLWWHWIFWFIFVFYTITFLTHSNYHKCAFIIKVLKIFIPFRWISLMPKISICCYFFFLSICF